jgi:hypothetical protein
MILLGQDPSWPTARRIMNDRSFLRMLVDFDADKVSQATMKKLEPYAEKESFTV